MSDAGADPCLSCGACCMTYRVSCYRADAAARDLPVALTGRVDPRLSCMAGTNAQAPRCSVHERRPEPCRKVQIGDDKCRHARARHGLVALS